MRFQVVTVTNRWATEPYYFPHAWRESLSRHGVEPVILGFEAEWRGLLTKPRTLQKWLMSGNCKADCLIVVDSYDLIFRANPAEIAEKWEVLGKPFIIGAERSLFPPDLGEASFPQSGSSYRFPNSGFIISTPADMAIVLDVMDLPNLADDHQKPDGTNHHGNDQTEYQRVFLKQPIPMFMDGECKFVWNMCGVDMSNLSFRENGLILNQETNTFPMVFHFNGGSKQGDVKDAIFNHLKLQ